jgi:hypothetical protein
VPSTNNTTQWCYLFAPKIGNTAPRCYLRVPSYQIIGWRSPAASAYEPGYVLQSNVLLCDSTQYGQHSSVLLRDCAQYGQHSSVLLCDCAQYGQHNSVLLCDWAHYGQHSSVLLCDCAQYGQHRSVLLCDSAQYGQHSSVLLRDLPGMGNTVLCCYVIMPSMGNTPLCCYVICPVWATQLCVVMWYCPVLQHRSVLLCDSAKYLCNTVRSLTWECRIGAKQTHSIISCYRLCNNSVVTAQCQLYKIVCKNWGQCFALVSVTRLLSLSWQMTFMVSRAYFINLNQPWN